MRIDDLKFEYDEEIYSLVSGLNDIDIVIQPVDSGFLAEVVDGAKVHMLGEFVSERWAKTSALEKAKEILASRQDCSSTKTAASVDDDEDEDDLVASMTTEDVREAILLAFEMMDVLPAFWRWSKTQNSTPSGDGEA